MRDRRGRDAGVDRALEVLGRVVDQQVDPDLLAARDLVVGAVELVVGQADPLAASCAVASCASPARCEVMWMKWPASCQAADGLDRARDRARSRGSAGSEWVSLTAARELLGLEAVDLPHDLLRVGDR